eukprot:353741-Chlamydomonas_euryale.AAC.2
MRTMNARRGGAGREFGNIFGPMFECMDFEGTCVGGGGTQNVKGRGVWDVGGGGDRSQPSSGRQICGKGGREGSEANGGADKGREHGKEQRKEGGRGGDGSVEHTPTGHVYMWVGACILKKIFDVGRVTRHLTAAS